MGSETFGVRYFKILTFIVTFLLINSATAAVKNARIDISEYNFNNDIIKLEGDWHFYWQKFINPQDGRSLNNSISTPFNALWNDISSLKINNHAKGYGSYELIIHSDSEREDLALYIPEFYSSYHMYLNGEKIAENGDPGNIASQTTPFWLPQAIEVNLKNGSNRLVIHVSNFHHHLGGPYANLQMGSADKISKKRSFDIAGSFLIYGTFLIAAIISLTLFYFYREDTSFLFFGLFAFIYSYRIIGADVYALHEVFPNFSWFIGIRMEYLSLYLSIIFFTYFYSVLIQRKVPDWMFHAVAGVSLLMCFTVFLAIEVFTMLLPYYLLLMFTASIVITAAYLFKMRFRNAMTWLTTMSVLSLFAIFILKALEQFNVIEVKTYVGFLLYLVFIITQCIALSQKFGFDLKKQYSKVSEAKDTQRHFLNSVSHELRTPMNAILGMTNFLMNSDLNEDQKKKVKTIKDNGENLNEILVDLLSFSAIDAGEIRLDNKRMDVKNIVDFSSNKVKEKYAGKSLDFDLVYENEIPNDLVGDEERIGQVLTNILDNAFKFTSKGSIKVKVAALEQDKYKVKLRFKVSDTGKGISKKELDRVLEAFYQGEQGDTRGYGGTGLGLTISTKIVEMMGGDLWIASNPGNGTTVEFEITMRRPLMDLSKEKQGALEDLSQLDPNLKILYAEDNPINQKLLAMMMKTMGYEIDIASDGLEAWEMALTKGYNVIFMDVQMPNMDGIESTKRIIRDVADRPVIIAVTANAGVSDRQKCTDAGMNDFISKPFNAKTLKEGLIKWQSFSSYVTSDRHDVSKYTS